MRSVRKVENAGREEKQKRVFLNFPFSDLD
jgi:hypothetical protein